MNDQAAQLRKIMERGLIAPQQKDMRIITVASGKGGVGKSNFSVNIALALYELKKRPIILDADFGLANVEIILGERPQYNLSHLIRNECDINELVTKSKYNIPFISGGSGIKDMNFLSASQIERIGNKLGSLENETDLLIIDTCAGINDIVVKFCNLASEVILVITPEPTSITDGYALIKTLVSQFQLDNKIKIVVNKVESKEEAEEVFFKLNYVTSNFLNFKIEYAGFVPYDEQVFKAVKEQVPVLFSNKNAKASVAYLQIAKNLIGSSDNVDNDVEKVHKKENWVRRFRKIFSH